ncbi:MAG: hypothetical protein E5W96_09905 [Mesorhizobium sp.]|nr:MAG: hypothetical protein E5W96_09905 [Mesorhizobium sp.]
MHAAQKCIAVLGSRHAPKQRSVHAAQKCIAVLGSRHAPNKDRCMSPKSAKRFWDNDMHQNKDWCPGRATA